MGCLAAASHAAGTVPLVSVLENNLLWVSANRVTENFAGQLHAAEPTNQLAGTILDLRGANGDSAQAALDYFSAKKSPLVILVDGQTQGAAATLAGQLHSAGAVVIACGTNAAAAIPADIRVPLAAEDEKRFLENPFTNTLATGAGTLAGATNLMFYVDHTSEAELVRKSVKDGEEEDSGSPRATPAQPVVHDPALARAVDLLKALAVLHRTRG